MVVFGFNGEPDHDFYRYFADKIKQVTTVKDETWITQQMIEIQAPKAFKILKNNLGNTLSSVSHIADDKPNKPLTTREIRRASRRQKKGMTQAIDINARISHLHE